MVLDWTFGYVIVRDADTDMVELVAVDRADGNVAWRYTLTADRPYSALRGQPTVVDGTVCVRGEAFGPEADPGRHLVAVEDGTERWRFQAGDDDITSPAVVDGRVYVGTHDPGAETGRVLTLDVADGSVAWETDLATEAASATVVSDGGCMSPFGPTSPSSMRWTEPSPTASP